MSGGLATGGAVLKSWSNPQAMVALSSGEAEFHSATKAAADLIAVRSMVEDLGWRGSIKLPVDATVAQSMANRQGIGKIRHLEVRFLWLQQLAKAGVIMVRKVSGLLNLADVLTKPMSCKEMMGKLSRVNIICIDLGPRGQVEGVCRKYMIPFG